MKIKNISFFLFVILFCPDLFSQKEYNNWYFGDHAAVTFNYGSPVALNNSQTTLTEASASISDKNGNLLFYTQGITVYNRNHQIMSNGDGLLGANSSSQIQIVPQPVNSRYYYIFTLDCAENHLVNGLRYSIVDMNLDNGNGGITSKNNSILAPAAEKVAVGKHSNGIDLWIVAHSWGNASFYSYLLSSSGLNVSPVISNIGSVHSGGAGSGPANNYTNAVGYLKFSPRSEKLAVAIHSNGVIQLFSFDKSTGKVSQLLASTSIDQYVYGLEFSPNENFLYTSTIYGNSKLFQFDIRDNSLSNLITIASPGSEQVNALQLGPDGKIYVASYGHYLSVIQNPDNAGISCNYTHNAIFLGAGTCIRGLPQSVAVPTVSLDFEVDNYCINDIQNFNIISNTTADSVKWNFGDPASGAGNFSSSSTPNHQYSSSGIYTVELSYFVNSIKNIVKKDIQLISMNKIELGNDTVFCEGNELKIDLINTGGTVLWSDGSNNKVKIIKVSGNYSVRVTNSCGIASDTISVTVTDCSKKIEIPNVFTPNSDNINDYWVIKNIELYPRVEVYVYTRWGNRVFKSRGYEYPWDGTFNGKMLPTGCYYYIIILNNGTPAFTGHVSIYR